MVRFTSRKFCHREIRDGNERSPHTRYSTDEPENVILRRTLSTGRVQRADWGPQGLGEGGQGPLTSMGFPLGMVKPQGGQGRGDGGQHR